MTMTRLGTAAILAAILGLGGAPVVQAQDDALDRLLEQLEGPTAEAETPDASDDPDRPSGEVSEEDKALDSLLEKLGQTQDAPTRDDQPPQPSRRGPADDRDQDRDPAPAPDRDDDEAAEHLTAEERELEEHIAEIAGRIRRRDPRSDDELSGPVGELVKRMREVEKRLSEPDTGEETRKRQQQIVKDLNDLLREAQSGGGQGQFQLRRMIRQAGQTGELPGQGQQPGQNPATTASRGQPERPTDRGLPADGKDTWGHLPDDLREEMANVFREDMLPSKEDLIRLYYLAVSRKSVSRGE